MSSQNASENRFLTAPSGGLFIANALPMILIMLMNGLLTVVDAAFLGHFVGANALTAVSVVFPVIMITIALATLVGGGMSSLIARHLGASKHCEALGDFAQAHGLALALSALLIVRLDMGVAGSAWGTAIAQVVGLAVLVGLRARCWRFAAWRPENRALDRKLAGDPDPWGAG